MQMYKNISGASPVISFEATTTSIAILFRDGGLYLYNYQKPGAADVMKMISLAQRGQGLATYISQHVKENHYRKLR